MPVVCAFKLEPWQDVGLGSGKQAHLEAGL